MLLEFDSVVSELFGGPSNGFGTHVFLRTWLLRFHKLPDNLVVVFPIKLSSTYYSGVICVKDWEKIRGKDWKMPLME